MPYKHEDEIDMNLFASVLQDAVSKVKTEENPEVLNDLKKMYKEKVPFTLRMYVAAYLAKIVATGTGKNMFRSHRELHENRARTGHDWKSRDTQERSMSVEPAVATVRKEAQKERVHSPKVQIDEALATTIFIGIGRNRRVYPRDLVGLLVSVVGLDRDRIGDIRVLANYSFVQLFSEDADRTIAALNGYDYRGRKLSVSYSRQKGEGSAADTMDVADSEAAMDKKNVLPGENEGISIEEDAAAYAAAEKAAANKEPFSAPAGKTFENPEPAGDTLLV